MKKILSLLLVLVMLLSVACAEVAAPSKTTDDLTYAEIEAENPDAEGYGDFIIYIVPGTDMSLEAIDQLKTAESIEAFFGAYVEKDGNGETLYDITEASDVTVYELDSIFVRGYRDEFGDVTAKLHFPTLYEFDEKDALMIGFEVTGENGEKEYNWYAFHGVGMGDGSVQVKFDPDTLKNIEAAGEALVAVVSDAQIKGETSGTADEGEFIIYVEPDTKESLEAKELLNAAESIDAFFEGYLERDGSLETLYEIAEAEQLNVLELDSIYVHGYRDEYGYVTARLNFPTQYQAGEKVAVLIGFEMKNEDGTKACEWYAYHGVGAEDGKVEVEFDPETLKAIEAAGGALVAVLCK